MNELIPLKSQKGTTLAEVIMAVAIMGVVGLGLAMAFIFGISSYQQAMARNMMQEDAMFALDMIAYHVHNARLTTTPAYGSKRLLMQGIVHESLTKSMEIEWDRGHQALMLTRGFHDFEPQQLVPSLDYEETDPGRVRVTECVFTTGYSANTLMSDQIGNHDSMSGRNGAVTVKLTLENGYGDVLHFERLIHLNNIRAGYVF